MQGSWVLFKLTLLFSSKNITLFIRFNIVLSNNIILHNNATWFTKTTMLINLYDLKSRPTKVINIENNICFDFSDIIYMELTFPCLPFFCLTNQHRRFKSMGNGYTNLVWDHCHWVWHNMFAAKYQSYKLKRIYHSNVNCNWAWYVGAQTSLSFGDYSDSGGSFWTACGKCS